MSFGNVAVSLENLPSQSWMNLVRGSCSIKAIQTKANRIRTTSHGMLLLDMLPVEIVTTLDCEWGVAMMASAVRDLEFHCRKVFRLTTQGNVEHVLHIFAPLKALLIHTGRHGMCSALLQSSHLQHLKWICWSRSGLVAAMWWLAACEAVSARVPRGTSLANSKPIIQTYVCHLGCMVSHCSQRIPSTINYDQIPWSLTKLARQKVLNVNVDIIFQTPLFEATWQACPERTAIKANNRSGEHMSL